MATTHDKNSPEIEIGIDAGARSAGRRPVAPARRHLHAVREDPQLPLERDGTDVPDAAHHVRRAVSGAGGSGGRHRRAPWCASGTRRLRASHNSPELTTIEEETGVPEAKEMIRQLVLGHEAVVRTARAVFASADSLGDQVTVDLLTERMQVAKDRLDAAQSAAVNQRDPFRVTASIGRCRALLPGYSPGVRPGLYGAASICKGLSARMGSGLSVWIVNGPAPTTGMGRSASILSGRSASILRVRAE